MNDPTITKCIVVADDTSGTRSFLGKLLRRHGYEVLEACDGEEALALAVSRPVDLFLCDLQMPRMRGEDVGRWIDQIDPPVPVILMTAYPSYESAVSAVRCHAVDYLEKPFRSLDVVVAAVEKALLRSEHAAARHTRRARGSAEDPGRRLATALALDVRRPLREVRNLTQSLLHGVHGPLTNEQREILDHVDREAATGEAEAAKVEFLACVESPAVRASLVPVPASELVQATVRTLASIAAAAGVELHTETPDPTVGVLADHDALPRALRAIGENALRFSGPGGKVVVRAVTESEGVRFEVRDDGIGIDPADHARIFEPYVRIENPITRRHGGCGLGLAFAQRIVEAHGARIEIRSAVGEGSVFSFVLPYSALSMTESCAIDLAQLLEGGARAIRPESPESLP